jgi:hypothetical protein
VLTDEAESGRGAPFGGAPSLGSLEVFEVVEIDKAQEIPFKFKHVVECRVHLTLGAGVGRDKSRTGCTAGVVAWSLKGFRWKAKFLQLARKISHEIKCSNVGDSRC